MAIGSGPTPAGRPDLPVSPAQREAAVAALVVHREAGRLNSVQFEDRQVLAEAAQSWSDLDRLFVDLPDPHPIRPLPPAGAGPVASDGPVSGGSSPMAGWGPRLVAATPILVLLLFFLTRRWQVFLLIPLVMILAGGAGRRR